MQLRNTPGCPCCGDVCDIGVDLFDDDLAQWTTTGSVSVSGGLLEMSGASSAIFTPAPATTDDGVWVQTFPMLSTDPANLRIVVCRLDASNYLFGEISRAGSDGTIRLGQRSGGADTYLTEPVPVEDTGSELEGRSTVELCFEPGEEQEPEEEYFLSYPSQASGGWMDPEFALDIEGDNFALFNLNALDDVTDFLVLYGLVPGVPDGATIDGIVWSVFHADQVPDNIIDFEVYLTTGTTVGDNKASLGFLGGSAPPAIQQDYGGPTDDWNAGLTSADVNSPLFGIALKYKNTGGDSSAVVVDYAVCTIYYTTPERQAGRLTLKYTNAAAPNTEQCIRAVGVVPGEGLGTGLLVVNGDWDFTEYTVKYHQSESRPECPECCDVGGIDPGVCACDCDPLAESYEVDLGVTGLNDDFCDCTEITGTFVVDFQGATGAFGSCMWLYEDNIQCALPDDTPWFIALQLASSGPGLPCRFVLVIQPGLVLQFGFGPIWYASDYFDEGECPEGEITLNRLPGNGSWILCDGITLPATITIEAV